MNIDGRLIPYTLRTASDYLKAKGLSQDRIDEMVDFSPKIYRLVNQIMALKQSCFLLRHTTHSCESLVDSLFSLKERLIQELGAIGFSFDDAFVEDFK